MVAAIHQGRAGMKASINTTAMTNELTVTIQGLNRRDLEQVSFYEGEV